MNIIVYQGHAEMFRWRLVGDDGVMIKHSELLETKEEAIAGAEAVADETGATIEIRETIQEVAEREGNL